MYKQIFKYNPKGAYGEYDATHKLVSEADKMVAIDGWSLTLEEALSKKPKSKKAKSNDKKD